MGSMKRGVVVEGKGSQVRVQFEDQDDMISPWLDVAQESTVGKRSFRRFKAGELVRVYLDDDGETGEALYALYNDQDPAPADDDELFYEEAADGSKLEWGGGKFRYTDPGGAVLEMAGDTVKITGDATLTGNLVITGDLTVEGKTDLQDTKINGIPQSGN